MPVLSLSDYWNKLPIAAYHLELPDNRKSSQSNDGFLWTTSGGVQLWQGSVSVQLHRHQRIEELETLTSMLMRSGYYFELTPKTRQRPALIPTFPLTNARVSGNQSAGYSLSVKGVNANVQFSIGDYVSFAMNGCNRLHRIAAPATATSNGLVTLTLDNPFTAQSAPLNNAVLNFVPPLLTAQIVPQSVSWGQSTASNNTTSGFSFSFIQAIRIQ